jgi:molybdenum cofactor synthesis domain-containing protein
MRVGILTVSDRSARGERPDQSGPALYQRAEALRWQVVRAAVVSDDREGVEETLREWSDSGKVDLILTTGGTGFSPRDQTPEATLAVVERLAPGLGEVMRAAGLKKTPHAMLSRAVAGIRGKTLIVNLPGSPSAALESLDAIMSSLPHAVELLQQSPQAETGHLRGGTSER